MIREIEAWSQSSPWQEFSLEVLTAYAILASFALCITDVYFELGLLVFPLWALWRCGISPRIWLKLLSAPLGLSALSALFLMLSLEVHDQGIHWVFLLDRLESSLLTLTRCVVMGALSTSMILIIPMNRLMAIFYKLKLPTEWMELITLSYSSVFELQSRWKQIRRAQEARLAQPSLMPRVQNLALSGSAILTHVLFFSQAWQRGLAARGYQGELRFQTPPVLIHPMPMFFACTLPLSYLLLYLGRETL